MIKDDDLVQHAHSTLNYRRISNEIEVGSVASALITDQDSLFTGICIDAKCGIGFCAEHAAIAAMLTRGEQKIVTIVAVNTRGQILPPCGRCRELMYQLDDTGSTRILLKDRVATLRDLLPDHWVKSKY